MPTPSTWQTGSVALKRAGDPAGLSRVAGLEFGLIAPAAAWPMLTVKGGVQGGGSTIASTARVEGASTVAQNFATIAVSPLGAISVPGQSVPSISETSGWEHVTLSYASQFDVTPSRLSAAMLIETAATSLRLCGGTVRSRTWNGTAVSDPVDALSAPKYVAYHTSGGYQVSSLSTTPIDLTTIDQPWLLFYWGNQSHWCETTKPINYSQDFGQGNKSMPGRYAYQADCPILVLFGSDPAAVVQTSGAGGLDLSWSSGNGTIAMLPLYGRLRQDTTVTSGWNSGANLAAGAKALIAAWYPRLQTFPRTIAETFAYDAPSDTATITETITSTTVRAGGTVWAPIRPMDGVARDTSMAGIAITVDVGGNLGSDVPGTALAVPGQVLPGSPLSGGGTTAATIVDGAIPTDFGPSLLISGVASYHWTQSGLDTYVAPRSAPGSGGAPANLQAQLDAEVDAILAHAHWAPWYHADRLPQAIPGGSAIWANPADTFEDATELVSVVSGSRQTNLISWLQTERAAFPPETTYYDDGSTGTTRGPCGVPATHGDAYLNFTNPSVFARRQWLWAAWGLARYYQVTSATPSSTVVGNLVNIIDSDMAEQDWATSHWLSNGTYTQGGLTYRNNGDRGTAVENATRHWAGLAGLAWLCAHQTGGANANEGLVRCLLAKATATRVAMTHLPRWQASVGLITLPTDLGSTAANDAWQPVLNSVAQGYLYTYFWHDSADDPRQVIRLNQFEAFLDDSNARDGWNIGEEHTYAPAYWWLTRPLAALLLAACGSECTIYLRKYAELQPDYWMPFAEATLGEEHGQMHPLDRKSLVLASIWLNGADAVTARRSAAFSHLAG